MSATEIPILFSLQEAADLCEVKPQVIRDWVAKAGVVPAVLGGKGRGKSHWFTVQQVIGLTTVCDRGTEAEYRPAYIRNSVARHAAWPWRAVAYLLGIGRQDMWSEEVFFKAARPFPDTPLELNTPLTPEDEVKVKSLMARFELIRKAVLARIPKFAGTRRTTTRRARQTKSKRKQKA